MTGSELCAGCNVREPWEHRCLGGGCPCEECREVDRLFGEASFQPELAPKAEDERPDAEGIRPLRAAIRNGRVYLDMVSLVEGYRARADALEERGYHDVAALYRREADELDTAAIGWLSEGSATPELPEPTTTVITVSKTAAALCADHLARHANPWVRGDGATDGAILAGHDPAGRRILVDIRVDRS